MARFNMLGLRKADFFGGPAWRVAADDWMPRLRSISAFPTAEGFALPQENEATRESLAGLADRPASDLAAVPLLAAPPADDPVRGAILLFDNFSRLPEFRGFGEDSAQYAMLLGADLAAGLIVNVDRGRILEGNAHDPEFGRGANDSLVLNGGLSFGGSLPPHLVGLESIVLFDGDYDLVMTDHLVPSGGVIEINGMPLADGDSLAFDGSAERDGRFNLFGSRNGDDLRGGGGDDLIYGEGGGDRLAGGAGADRFGYGYVSDSTGTGYDTLLDFDFGEDRLDLSVSVTGFAATVRSGSLSVESFDSDLAGALVGLGAGKAAFYTPDAGNLAGKVFLVVDANGVAGYQAGQDYVFAMASADAGALPGGSEFFV